MNPLDVFLDTFKGGVTFKKVFAFTLLLLVVLLAALVFEQLTGTWELRRLEKTTVILSELKKLGDPTQLSPELKEVYYGITQALAPSADNTTTSSGEIPRWISNWIVKFLAGGSLWFFFAVAFIAFMPKKQEGTIYAFLAMLMIGSFFGGINALIPTIYHPLVNLTAIPFLMFGATAGIPMSISAITGFRKVRETSIEKAITNNLRQLASAADQYFLESGESIVETSALVGTDGYMRDLKPVAEEIYPETIQQGQNIIAKLPNGKDVSLKF